MPRAIECSLTQLAIEAIIKAYGIKCANKKSHHSIREQAINDIVSTLKWYKGMCDYTDKKGGVDGRK